jgi:lysyl-tRNA synthetase class 2
MALSEQEQIRRESLDELRKLGINPYPAAEFKTNVFARDIQENFAPEKNNFQNVCLAGRIMSRRIMGNASFAEIMDSSGRVQIYVRRDDVCPGEDKVLYNTVFKHLLDIGDIIGVTGSVFRSQTGETTVHVKEFTILSKSIRPLPVVKEKDGILFDAVTDPEMRYRQRYVDLIVNPQVRDVFRKRTRIIQSMRELFNSHGYLEVETPILQPIPGGASARPFITHHNTLDMELYLRIANELYLKRLIVGGFEGVYEFAKDFRNEGMDRTHNPEFTVMEIYIAYKDYNWMMNFTEEIVKKVALDLYNSAEVAYGDTVLNLNPPYKRISMLDAIKDNTGIDISGMDEDAIRKVCDTLNVANSAEMGKGKLIDTLFGEKCEHNYIQPPLQIICRNLPPMKTPQRKR